MILGNQKVVSPGGTFSYKGQDLKVVYPRPIGEPGSWQFSFFPQGPWFAMYLAFTLPWINLHFRIGARWDDVDDYVEFPSIAIKRV